LRAVSDDVSLLFHSRRSPAPGLCPVTCPTGGGTFLMALATGAGLPLPVVGRLLALIKVASRQPVVSGYRAGRRAAEMLLDAGTFLFVSVVGLVFILATALSSVVTVEPDEVAAYTVLGEYRGCSTPERTPSRRWSTTSPATS